MTPSFNEEELVEGMTNEVLNKTHEVTSELGQEAVAEVNAAAEEP